VVSSFTHRYTAIDSIFWTFSQVEEWSPFYISAHIWRTD